MNLEQLYSQFRRSRVYLKNVTKDTLRFYDFSWVAVKRHWDIEDSSEITKEILNDLVIAWREDGLQPVSINTYLSFLNAFLRWGHEEGYIPQLFTIKKLKTDLKIVKIFNDKDVQRIVNYKPKEFYEWRLWTMICLLLDTGVRASEALHLTVQDVNLDQLILTVRGKGQKDRLIPISLEMRKIFFKYMKINKISQGFMFPTKTATSVGRRNFQRDIIIFCRRLGISDARLSPHTFRLYFAISYLRRGGDIYSLSRILGHTSVKVTEVYLRSMGVEDFQSEQQRLSPVARFFKKLFSF